MQRCTRDLAVRATIAQLNYDDCAEAEGDRVLNRREPELPRLSRLARYWIMRRAARQIKFIFGLPNAS